ncbi:MAG TPA: cytochrome D1 domain-containing protein [Bryobacteraceae bacterium]|nr:cytochrome D1 domain-containing protein [Bryobacteraceae bacterium]
MRQARILLSACTISFAALLAAPSTVLNHPTGNRGLFMVDKLGAHLRFFDPVTFKELASIETPLNPHDFTLSADHSLAYVPIYGDGVYGRNLHPGHEIEIVDLAAHKIIGAIDVAPYRAPHGIQIDSKGLLYVTCDLDRKLLVVDPKKRSVLEAIDTDGTGHWDALLADGSKIYITNKTDRPFISVIDLRTRKMIAKVPAPGGTEGIAASPDGKTVVAMDHTEPFLIVIDPKTDRVLDRIPLRENTKGAYKLYFSPDGKRLLTMNMAEKSVNVFDASNLRGEQRLLQVGKDPMGIAFSPDGKTALVANHGDGSVSVIDLEKMQVVNNFHAGTGIETLAYY